MERPQKTTEYKNEISGNINRGLYEIPLYTFLSTACLAVTEKATSRFITDCDTKDLISAGLLGLISIYGYYQAYKSYRNVKSGLSELEGLIEKGNKESEK